MTNYKIVPSSCANARCITAFDVDEIVYNKKNWILYPESRTWLFYEIKKSLNCVSKTIFSEVFIFSGDDF